MYLKIVKIHLDVGPLWSILVCKIPQIWTTHHTFLESRHPEVTKNRYYFFSSEWSQKKISAHGLVTLSGIVVIHLFLTRYRKLLRELHIEPKNEEMVGTFLSVATEEGKETVAKSTAEKSNMRRKKWDQETFRICSNTQDQKRIAQRKLLCLTSLFI